MKRKIDEEGEEDTPHEYQSIKCSLKSVLKDDTIMEILEANVKIMHTLITRTLLFMKCYYLKCYYEGEVLFAADSKFVINVMKTMTIKNPQGRPSSEENNTMQNHLKLFYEENMGDVMPENDFLNCKNLATVMAYAANDIVQNYENNIKTHFIKHVGRFVNVMYEKKRLVAVIKETVQDAPERQRRISELCSFLKKVKNDLLLPHENFESDESEHEFILETRANILPQRPLEEDSAYLDISIHPWEYLNGMIYMSIGVEQRHEKLYNVFPLVTTIIPGHIRLDTTCLVNLFVSKKHGIGAKKKYNDGNVNYQAEIWGHFFKIEKKQFYLGSSNHHYGFDYQILTDGVSVVLLLKRKSLLGVNKRGPTRKRKKKKKKKEKYISDEDIDLDELKNKKLVAIDPNMGDLLFCVDSDRKDQTKFR